MCQFCFTLARILRVHRTSDMALLWKLRLFASVEHGCHQTYSNFHRCADQSQNNDLIYLITKKAKKETLHSITITFVCFSNTLFVYLLSFCYIMNNNYLHKSMGQHVQPLTSNDIRMDFPMGIVELLDSKPRVLVFFDFCHYYPQQNAENADTVPVAEQ